MKCPHCSITIHVDWKTSPLALSETRSGNWGVKATVCPNCREPIIKLGVINGYVTNSSGIIGYEINDQKSFLAHPKFPRRTPIGDAIPPSFKSDYVEACDVLSISAKASAALLAGFCKAYWRSRDSLVEI